MADDHDNATWLARTNYETRARYVEVVWEMYLKFYTVFLALNITGIGLAVQHLETSSRWPIAAAFLMQNALSFGTAVSIGRFTKTSSDSLKKSGDEMAPTASASLTDSPIPGALGLYCGWANAVSHVALSAVWISTLFGPDLPQS